MTATEEALIPPPVHGADSFIRVETSPSASLMPHWHTVYYGPDRDVARDRLWAQLLISQRTLLVRVTTT